VGWIAALIITAYLRRAGGHYLAGMRMRDGNPIVEQVLSRQGRYQDVRDNLRGKEIRLDDADGTRFILCHNPDQATRDQARRTADLDRIGRTRPDRRPAGP
jgi:hypothetical protein